MKATYSDFISENKNCSGFEFNTDAKKIFDFLNQDENIIKMAEYADQNKPALAGCVLELEQFYNQMQNPTIDFTDGFTRTVVGRMVKTIIKPFGYSVTKQKDFPKNKNAEYFFSASCYKLDTRNATMRIIKKVESIER